MDQTMFKDIADKVAKEVEWKMRSGVQSSDGGSGSDSNDFMQSETGREIYKSVADEIAQSVARSFVPGMSGDSDVAQSESPNEFMSSEAGKKIFQNVAGEIAKSMGPQFMGMDRGAGSCKTKDSKSATEQNESAGQKKILETFGGEIDGLLSTLEGRIDTILELCEEGDLSHEAASKKFKRTRLEFRESLRELRKKKDWKLGFVNRS